ncbi:hypothetical protein D3C79_914140 [compost metagenome]
MMDSQHVPESLHHLIPLARRFGVADDLAGEAKGQGIHSPVPEGRCELHPQRDGSGFSSGSQRPVLRLASPRLSCWSAW